MVVFSVICRYGVRPLTVALMAAPAVVVVVEGEVYEGIDIGAKGACVLLPPAEEVQPARSRYGGTTGGGLAGDGALSKGEGVEIERTGESGNGRIRIRVRAEAGPETGRGATGGAVEVGW